MWSRSSNKPDSKVLFNTTADAWLDRPRHPRTNWPLEEQGAIEEELQTAVEADQAVLPPLLPANRLVRLMAGQYQDVWTLPQNRTVLIGRAVPGHAGVVDIDLTPDLAVSRKHARLWYADERWWIEDMQSVNGTWVGLHDIRGRGAVPLPRGSTLLLGQTMLLFAPQE